MKKKIFFIIFALSLPLFSYMTSVHSQQEKWIQLKAAQPSFTPIEGNYWAIVIGINEYGNLPKDKQLEAAKPDAMAMADLLHEKYGFAKERTIELYDRKATRSQIIRQLRILAKTLTDKDLLLIYYAGHGEYDKGTKLGSWIPSDAILDDISTYVSNEDVRAYIRAIKAKHIYTIVDSCFSESLMGRKTRSLKALNERVAKELYQDKSRWILTSGGLYPVHDKGRENHSIFAYYLLRILERNNRKYLTPLQIIAELQPLVSNCSQQTPKSAPIVGTGDEGGQFIFTLAHANLPLSEDLRDKELDIKLQDERKRKKEGKGKEPIVIIPGF